MDIVLVTNLVVYLF